MAAHPPSPPPLQIQFSFVWSQAAPGVASSELSRTFSPLMTVGYLRRQAWVCAQPYLPSAPDGTAADVDQMCLRLVCSGIVLSDDLKLLQEYLKSPPAINVVFVVFKPPQGHRPLQHTPRALLATIATSASDAGDRPTSEDTAEGEYFCRICHGDGPATDFIHPCACSGSMRFVHAACLARWRSVATNAAARTQCEQCHQLYRITQEWWVQPLLAPSLIFACSSVGVALAIIVIGVLLQPFAEHFLSLLLLPPDTAFQWAVSGCFVIGALSFFHLVHMRFSWMFFRGGVLHINWHSLLLTLMPLVALQEMMARVIIAIGFLHAVTQSYAELRGFAMRYCSAHGERILSLGNSQ
jgi:hypothetical protein